MSPDKIPLIGRIPGAKRLFVTTGFSAWGMTTSFVSARLLTDLITGTKNEWEDLYNPNRLRG
jgi:glycine/D-amino acid oxidase-like deaminating enzyme